MDLHCGSGFSPLLYKPADTQRFYFQSSPKEKSKGRLVDGRCRMDIPWVIGPGGDFSQKNGRIFRPGRL